MSWVPQIAAELKLRSSLLPNELRDWQRDAEGNVNGEGLHQSQVAAINVLFDELEKTQARLLGELGPAGDLPAFKKKRLELEQELTGTHGIISIFRFVLGQREDPRYYRAALDFADLVAADCYRSCVERAAGWGAIDKTRFRAPPLTYLNASLSPAAFTRRHAFGAFKMPIEGSTELKLPISIVSLPFHHTSAVWTFCSLHHEVGHIVDQDLALFELIRPLLEAAIAEDRRPVWSGWLRELIADAFGVLLGHAGYAHLLAKLLLMPDAMVAEQNPADKHPTPYVRVMLLAALLKAAGVPDLSNLADAIANEWKQTYAEPQALKALVNDCSAVAAVLMNSKLPSLKNHALSELAPPAEMSAEHAAVVRLASYLRTGAVPVPPVELKQKVGLSSDVTPARLVPIAAQMATATVTVDHDATYAGIQERSLEYMTELRQGIVELLGDDDEGFAVGGGGAREQYYRQLVRDLRFNNPDKSEE